MFIDSLIAAWGMLISLDSTLFEIIFRSLALSAMAFLLACVL